MPSGSEAPVALVCAPVFATDAPSLGLSLLKAGLATRHIHSRTYYLNIQFAEAVGLERHRDLLAWPQLDLANEWIFAKLFWGAQAAPDEAYFQEIVEGGAPEHRDTRFKAHPQEFVQTLLHCRCQAAAFVDRCVRVVPWKDFRIVGFQSQFQQQLASLTLARRIKELYPEVFIVFGGANATSDMGCALLGSFPFLDAVCTGEGDIVFPQLVSAVLAGNAPTGIPGILCRGHEWSSAGEYPMVVAMDRLPYPDHGDFFDQRTRRSSLPAEDYYLVLETSRGCWWGQKSQCTFCGLHKDEVRYRQKSAPRVLRELAWLLGKYGPATHTVLFTDLNLSHGFIKTLLPRLRTLNARYQKHVFYETRVYCRKEDVRLMRRAGVRSMQPGLESFSDALLRRMRKGTTSLQNIQFLKWCAQFGIRPGWNLIYGFPGEREADYARLPDIIRAIVHLAPPVTNGPIRFDRFGPYHREPSAFGIRNLRPFPAYRHVYAGLDAEAISGLAYFFTGDWNGHERLNAYTNALVTAVDEWLRCWKTSALFTVQENGRYVVCDFRPDAREAITPLTRTQSRLYRACDQIVSRAALLRILSSALRRTATEADLDFALAPLMDRRFLLEEGHSCLGLAVPLEDDYFPPQSVWPRIPEILAALDRI